MTKAEISIYFGMSKTWLNNNVHEPKINEMFGELNFDNILKYIDYQEELIRLFNDVLYAETYTQNKLKNIILGDLYSIHTFYSFRDTIIVRGRYNIFLSLENIYRLENLYEYVKSDLERLNKLVTNIDRSKEK